MTEVVNSSGESLGYTYDDSRRVTSWTDRNGHWYQYTYDDVGRCVHGTGTEGFLDNRFAYDTAASVTRMTDSLGAVREYAWDRWGRVVAETDPLGRTVRTEWDAFNNKVAAVDQLGNTTRYSYDALGNLVGTVHPDGSFTVADYDPVLCRPTTTVNPDGTRRVFTWDARGNLLVERDESGAETRCHYDEHGHLAEVADALGGVTLVRCDAAGLPIAVTNPLGHTERTLRDAFGRAAEIVDAMGRTTLLAHSVEGKSLRRELPDGSREEWEWDGEGNLLRHRNSAGYAVEYEFGPFDLPTAQTTPDGRRHAFSYDTEMRLAAVTNPQGLTWTYERDAAGRVVRETDFNSRQVAYRHDATGNLAARVNGAGEEVTYGRDVFGRVTSARDSVTGDTSRYAYDGSGRLTRAVNSAVDLALVRDALGRVVAETSNGRTVANTYDALGRRTHRKLPSGHTSEWSYDAAGRPVRLATAGHAFDFGYDAVGNETERRFGDRVAFAWERDLLDRPIAQSLTAGARPDKIAAALSPEAQPREVHRRTYSWRGDGHITALSDDAVGNRKHRLDPSGRITAVQAEEVTERYEYDGLGNITRAEWPAVGGDADARGARTFAGTLIACAGRTSYEHDAQGRLVRTTRRDLSGKSRTWRYRWDAADRLVGVTTPANQQWTYVYDALGRRTGKLQGAPDGEGAAESTEFVWDDLRLAEYTADDSGTLSWDYTPRSWTPIARSLTGGDGAAAVSRTDAVQTDVVGRVLGFVDVAGGRTYRIDSVWGVPADPHGGFPDGISLPGQYRDEESGLHHNGFRFFDPETATYASPDPLGLGPSPNPHAYVVNPISRCDPMGLAPYSGPLRREIFGQSRAELQQRIQDVVDFHDMHGRPPTGTWQGGLSGQPAGTYGNNNNFLPNRPLGYYEEMDIWPRGTLPHVPGYGNRGEERLVFGANGEVYYTNNHYDTFIRLR